MSGARIHDVAETTAYAERRLRDGTKLQYKLSVLQQPMIARACGMGAKSHADRRPVDPPPVVELKIFAGEEKADVTFSHNSNFFLFATLEQARPIAQGRGMPAPAPQPVLTGVPVSGMAYLDRPTPAGYFIFPDLSVRHEGKYRLRFALYEESKDREEAVQPTREGEPTEFCNFRVEVKSKPFTVFSAKKFPGLKESTALSRIVAEQGCRVRIRRDVRMRRRSDRLSGRDGELEMDETAMLRSRGRRETPEYDGMRAQGHQPQPLHPMQRSNSIGRKRSDSDVSIASMPDAAARYDDRYTPRPEHGSYGPPPPPPPAPSAAPSHHLDFGTGSLSHHPAPPNIHPPQTYSHQAPSRGYSIGPGTAMPQQAAPAPPPQSQPISNAQYSPASQIYHREAPVNGHGMHHVRRGSGSQDYSQYPTHVRRESDPTYMAPPHYRPATPSISSQGGQYQHMPYEPQYHVSASQQSQYQPPPPPPPPSQPAIQYQPQTALPPLKLQLPPLAMEPSPWRNSVSSPSTNVPSSGALPSPSVAYGPPSTSQPQQHVQAPLYRSYAAPPPTQAPYIPTSASIPPPPASSVPAEEPRGTKRTFGRVFNDSHITEPLRGGSRPDTSSASSTYGQEPASFEDDDDFDLGKLKMKYRRADGEEIVRRLPLDE